MASVAFNVGAGYVVPTQLIFVPMLLLLPTPLVPLLVMFAAVLTRIPAVARGQSAPQRLVLAVNDDRKALPVSAAVEELHRCSGTQFDPHVVAALLAVVGDPGWELTVSVPQAAPALPQSSAA